MRLCAGSRCASLAACTRCVPGLRRGPQQPSAAHCCIIGRAQQMASIVSSCLSHQGGGTFQRLPRAVNERSLCSSDFAVCPHKTARSLRALPHINLVSMCLQVEQLQKGLCGVSRPHFFRGVATVSAPAVLLRLAGSPSSSAEACLPPVVLLEGGRCSSHAHSHVTSGQRRSRAGAAFWHAVCLHLSCLHTVLS